ncbi:hypothetical protein FGG78_40290, partial [Thioclava sp. BHET1]
MARDRLRWPLRLTFIGLIAERGLRAFWPVWSLFFALLAALAFGVGQVLSPAIFWPGLLVLLLALLGFGWRGWRRFRIAAKTPETAEICSFRLVPVDGGPVLRHRPGQYLSFRFTPTEGEEYRRNYSISCAPNGRDYRITVKREAGGRVSNWLHREAGVGTEVDVAPPAGEFFLDPAGKQEVVLLSAGVGLTPMVAILDTFGGGDLPLIHIHA